MGVSDSILDEMRLEGDPLADDLVGALVASHSVERVNRLLGTLVRNDQPPAAELPDSVQDFLATSGALPHWADPNRLALGSEVFVRNGALCMAALMTAALPECYAMGPGVRVLGLTQRISEHATRRIYETAQMLVDVMMPGGLAEKGEGVRAAQRVRLMHAAVRHLALADTRSLGRSPRRPRELGIAFVRDRWDPRLGLPINQEQMAYTILTFSWVILRSLETFGVALDAAERSAYVHTWAVVGHVMGVRDELLPTEPEAAGALYEQIYRRNLASTREGRQLTRSLIRAFVEIASDKAPFPHLVRPELARVLIRAQVKPSTAEAIGVRPLARWERWLSRLLFTGVRAITEVLDDLGDATPRWAELQAQVGAAIVAKLAEMPRGLDRGLFRMPLELAAAPTGRAGTAPTR